MLPLERRQALADRVGVREQYLYQILRGLGTPAPALARKLNSIEPALELKDLRPDVWQDIWPELADSKQKHLQAPANQARVAINSEVKEGAHA